jgi:hypothetical protein
MQPENKRKAPWLYSASELCRPNDRRLSVKSVPSFAMAVNFGFLDRIQPEYITFI